MQIGRTGVWVVDPVEHAENGVNAELGDSYSDRAFWFVMAFVELLAGPAGSAEILGNFLG